MSDLVSLPDSFLDENFVPFPTRFDTLFCPSCRQRSFYEMRGPIPMRGLTKIIKRFIAILAHKSDPIVWYLCSNCGVRARKSELNDVITQYLGESKIVKIDMTGTSVRSQTNILSSWLKRAQGWWWN